MQQPCPTCEYQNTDESIYCLRCGKKLSPTEGFSLPSEPQHTNPQLTRTGLLQGEHVINDTPPGAGDDMGSQSMNRQGSNMFSNGPAQMGSQSSAIIGQKLRHAFAGYGRVTTHQSWLLEGKKDAATSLYTAVARLVGQRNFLSLGVHTVKLLESGYWPEEREYIVMRRGVATIFIYIAPAGYDIYISRTTMVQLSFDTARIIIATLLGIELISPFLIIPILTSSIGNAVTAGSNGAYQIIFPLFITIMILLLYLPTLVVVISFLYASFRNWLSEKDFLVYLRRNTLNDFELDDVELLEHATDDTIITATKQINLDATKITPPATGYQTRRRIRII